MVHCYSVYGVALASDTPFDLPANPNAEGRAHVSFVRAGERAFAGIRGEQSGDPPWMVCRQDDDGSIYLRWSEWFEFAIDPGGTVVRYRPLDRGERAVLQNFLFSQTLSFALVRQGLEPVHAAVVDIGGSAVALLGDCGYGKSSLAAALVGSGCRLLSDDVLMAYPAGQGMIAAAGAGRIKLHADSASALLADPRDGVPVNPLADKRVYRLPDDLVQRRHLPLRACVVLPEPDRRDGADRVALQPIGPANLFHELVRNTFVRPLGDRGRLRRNFASNARLASAVAGFRLSYPAGIDRLGSVGRAIIEQFRGHFEGDVQ